MKPTPFLLAAAALVLAVSAVPLVRAEDLLPPAPEPSDPSQPAPLDLPRLLRDLASPSSRVRERAARAIERMGPGALEATPFLVRALVPRPTAEVRAVFPPPQDPAVWAAADALAAIGPAAAPRVIVALRDGSPQVREAAAYALGRMEPPPEDAIVHLVRLLEDGERTVRDMAAQSLSRFGAPAVERVVHALGSGRGAAREAAARALSLLDPADLAPALPALARALETPYAPARVAVAQALARAPADDADAIVALLSAMGDRDPAVRGAAASSLERVGRAHPAATAALVEALADRDPSVRLQAAKSVATRGAFADRVVTPLARLLSDPDDLLAMAAAGSLARIGPDAGTAVLPLLDLLRSGRPGLVRAAAADALGALGPRASAAGPALRRIAAADDEDPRVRSAAAVALEGIGQP